MRLHASVAQNVSTCLVLGFLVVSCASRKEFSKDQIVRAADVEAQRFGLDANNSDVTYDVGNAKWQAEQANADDFARRNGKGLPPHLYEGPNCQVVIYRQRGLVLGGPLYVFVDRMTGRVLGSIDPP